MSFDPLELLQLAEGMDQSAEASCRTIVNRSYYAVFIKAREVLRAQGLVATRGTGQEHGDVIHALAQNRRGVASHQLSGLRKRREVADYQMDHTVGQADAQKALASARLIERLLSRDWGTS